MLRRGVLFSRKVTERNKNVIKAFGRWRRVWSDAPDALHLIRTVCRSRALEMIKKTRWDADGADDVDIEASSRFLLENFQEKADEARGDVGSAFLEAELRAQRRDGSAISSAAAPVDRKLDRAFDTW